jgi:hypothetical protein
MSSITSQNLKLKHNLYIAKQNRKIFLRCKLDQLKQLVGVNCTMHVSLGGYWTWTKFKGSSLDFFLQNKEVRECSLAALHFIRDDNLLNLDNT